MQKWILTGLGLALLILVLNGILAYRNLQALVDNQRLVTHTHEVQREVEGLLTDIRDMGTGQGGYLLTGDETYLLAFDAIKERVPKRIDALRMLTADNRRQQERLNKLQPLAAARIKTLEGLIETRRTKGFD